MDLGHPTVRYTDELRAAAESLRGLGGGQIAASDDPLTVVQNLRAALDAIRDAWPSVARSAGFADSGPQHDDVEAVADFTDDIERGLKLAVDGMQTAVNSI